MAHIYILVYIATCVALAITSRWRYWQKRRLLHIPSITTDLPLLSYIGALQYTFGSRDVLQRGYDQFKGGIFKVPEIFRWHVLVTGKTLVEELRKAREKDLNLMDAMADVLHTDYTIGRETHDHPYQDRVMRTFLTRNLDALYPEVHNELHVAVRELIPLGDEWTKVPAFATVAQIICRTSNRAFVGLPLCRSSEFIKLNTQFTIETMKAGFLVGAVPTFLREFVASWTAVESMKRQSETLLRPVIEEILQFRNEYGAHKHEDPSDIISALIDAVPEGHPIIPSVALRILVINFTAIHTTAMTFVHVLYHLASSPDFQAELREEVDSVVEVSGWTSEALARMTKVDSFIKETLRFNGVGAVALTRKALKDFVFSDGTVIPSGTLVSTALRAVHFDTANYQKPDVFDPWRFVPQGTEAHEDHRARTAKNRLVDVRPEYMAFGLGNHACPGRFFASMELKTLLAKLVHNYDMRSEKAGTIPSPMWILTFLVPNKTANVLFRKRRN